MSSSNLYKAGSLQSVTQQEEAGSSTPGAIFIIQAEFWHWFLTFISTLEPGAKIVRSFQLMLYWRWGFLFVFLKNKESELAI